MGGRLLIVINVVLLGFMIVGYSTGYGRSGTQLVVAQSTAKDPADQRLIELERFVRNSSGLCYYFGNNRTSDQQFINEGIDIIAFDEVSPYGSLTLGEREYSGREVNAMTPDARAALANNWAIRELTGMYGGTTPDLEGFCPPGVATTPNAEPAPTDVIVEPASSEQVAEMQVQIDDLQAQVDDLARQIRTGDESSDLPDNPYRHCSGEPINLECGIKLINEQLGTYSLNCSYTLP